MPVQSRLATIGLGEQSGEGSPAAAAEYQIGVVEGQVVNVDVSEEDLPSTWTDRVSSERERLSAVPMGQFTVVAMPQSIGQFLKAALGNVATSGAGPFTHDFTVADALPYNTLFTRYGAEYRDVEDAKVSSLEFSWDRNQALRCAVTMMGRTLTFQGTSPFTVNSGDERPVDGYFRGAGGTFLIDGGAARITAGTITVENSMAAIIAGGAVTPDTVFESMANITASLTVVPDDLDLWRTFLTGSASGTSIQGEPYSGGFDLTFVDSQDSAQTLQFDADDVAFLAAFPAAAAAGGAAQLEVEGKLLGPTGNDPITVTLNNNVSGY